MPNNHPYDKKGDRRQQNLNDLVDGAVNFGLDISSTVLSGIAGALDSVGDSLNRAAQRPEQNSFIAYRRKLDNSLAGHYGGWMTMGVLGWVFGGCFAIAALVMAILAGAAPNDASLWSAMPVFNILAPTFTACTLGFFCHGVRRLPRSKLFWPSAPLPARHARLYGGAAGADPQQRGARR